MNNNDDYLVWNSWVQMSDLNQQGYGLIEKSNRVDIINSNKRTYFDTVSSMFNCSLGYMDTRIKDELVDQFDKIMAGTNHWMVHRPTFELAKKLSELTSHRLNHFYFTNSGSEANETAIKIIRQYYNNINSEKYIILSLDGCYHGATLGALSLSLDKDDKMFGNMLDGFLRVSTYDSQAINPEKIEEGIKESLDRLEGEILKNDPSKIAALFYEPIQLSNKVNILPDAYIEGLYNLSRKYDFILVADEVATGFGRCGEMFYSNRFSFYPDIILMAKGISAGFIPLGAVGVCDYIFDGFLEDSQFKKNAINEKKDISLNHGFTTSGNPLATRCSLAVIRVLEDDNLIDNAKNMGEVFYKSLLELSENHQALKSFNVKGLLISLILDLDYFKGLNINSPSYFLRDLLKRKGIIIYVESDFDDTIIIAPPLVITKDQVQLIISALRSCFKKIEKLEEMAQNGLK